MNRYEDQPDSIMVFLDEHRQEHLENTLEELMENRILYMDRMEERDQQEGMTPGEARTIAADRVARQDAGVLVRHNEHFSQGAEWPGVVSEAAIAMNDLVFGKSRKKLSPEFRRLMKGLRDGNPGRIQESYRKITEVQAAITRLRSRAHFWENSGDANTETIEMTVRQTIGEITKLSGPELIGHIQTLRQTLRTGTAASPDPTVVADCADEYLYWCCEALQAYLDLGGQSVLQHARRGLRIGLTLMEIDRQTPSGNPTPQTGITNDAPFVLAAPC